MAEIYSACQGRSLQRRLTGYTYPSPSCLIMSGFTHFCYCFIHIIVHTTIQQFDFCRFCVIIRFFIPTTMVMQWPPTWERASISLTLTLSAIQRNTGTILKTSGMMRFLTGDWTRGPPALDASTLPLSYRGGSHTQLICNTFSCVCYTIIVKSSHYTKDDLIGCIQNIYSKK